MDFVVDKADLSKFSVLDSPPLSLAKGQVLAKVQKFAFTSNNISYGATGDVLHYWDFYPHHDQTKGRIPVWGFAQVVASRTEGIEAGQRFYGFLPMSSWVVLEPSKVTAEGFVQRRADRLAAAYNYYTCCQSDPLHIEHAEDLLPVLRPVYLTSWIIDDFLTDNNFFGADTVVISSASSKTAYGLAHTLRDHQRPVQVLSRVLLALSMRVGARVITLIGVTSEKNLPFVLRLGLYDRIISYRQIETLDASHATVFVDMAGNAATLKELHLHYKTNMKYSCLVGGTHWDAGGFGGAPEDLPGATPTFFFAPKQFAKRAAEWGGKELQARLSKAWSSFVEQVQLNSWCVAVPVEGSEALGVLYTDVLQAKVPPSFGYICSMDKSGDEEPQMLDGRALLAKARSTSML